MNPLLTLFIFLSVSFSAFSQITILRRPALSPDGSQIAFTFQGDIWTVPKAGGKALRLTIHEGYESYPTYSPDGSRIAFSSSRNGNNDIYSIAADGSDIVQHTFHSVSDNFPAWHGNDSILFSTNRVYATVDWEDEIHAAGIGGGTPIRRLNALGKMATTSPDGRYIAFVRGSCRLVREAYRGPANRDIWVYDTQSKEYFAVTTDEGMDIYPDWGPDNALYFLSAKTGKYNVYKQAIEDGKATGEAQALTNFSEEGIRYFDLSADGKTIILSQGVDFWISNTDNIVPQKLRIETSEDYRFDPVENKTLTKDVEHFALSPDEKQIAFEVRGELFVTKNDKEDSRTTTLTHHPWRDKDMVWLNDSTLIFLSDREGNYDLYMLRSSDKEEIDLFKSLRHEVIRISSTSEEEDNLTLSPDGKKIAFVRGRGTLVVAEVDSTGMLGEETILLDGWSTPNDIDWSPDSRWLAYSMDDLDFNEEVYVQPIDKSRPPTNVSLHPRGDRNPIWSKDGKKLGFVSNRNNGDDDVWFVWLRKEDWEKTKADWIDLEKDGPKDSEKKKEDKDDEEDEEEGPEPIQIDFDDIYQRLEQVTRLSGNENRIAISNDGERFFFVTNGGGRASGGGKPQLMSIKWDGSDIKTVLGSASGVRNLTMDEGGKNLYMVKSGGLAHVSVEGGSPTSLPFSARMKVHYQEERKQIFDEAWRALNLDFYDPNFHGRNWEALRAIYRPRALAASTDIDFRSLINEMLGQLNASHMGLYGGGRAERAKAQTGLLGLELRPGTGGLTIASILPASPADRTESKLSLGETILAVNDESVEDKNMYQLLEGTAGQRTLLSVRGTDGKTRDVDIRPARRLSNQEYEFWVKSRKALTEKYSNGRLGYIHVQAMGWSSFERFERELTAAGLGKDGILIDVRFNGGGWTTDMLMTVLNVRQHAYTIPRGATDNLEQNNTKFKDHYPYGERLPLSSWTKPSAALCNQYSYSNAEIFSHAFKTLGHGPLIGMPTFGAVISTGGKSLMNDYFVRMPFRAWYVLATGENMENGPAVPTHVVPHGPEVKGSGEDPQLKKAVEVLLESMED